jgi:hypothetical protein
MAVIFEPLSIDNIEEGDFVNEINRTLLDVQHKLAAYREKYGDKSKKATAELVVKIKLRIEEPDQDLFSIHTSLAPKVPLRPSRVTVATQAFDQDGRQALFVRKSGSDADDPRQGKMFDGKGRVVGQQSGLPDDDDE